MDPILYTPWRMPYLRGEDRQDYDGCLFCIKGQHPERDAAELVVARGEHVYATLNRYPYNNGHLLIVPYAHVATPEDLSADALADLMMMVNRALAAVAGAGCGARAAALLCGTSSCSSCADGSRSSGIRR